MITQAAMRERVLFKAKCLEGDLKILMMKVMGLQFEAQHAGIDWQRVSDTCEGILSELCGLLLGLHDQSLLRNSLSAQRELQGMRSGGCEGAAKILRCSGSSTSAKGKQGVHGKQGKKQGKEG